uniref:DNA-3-methyladenine glycosylase n=1 Tax=Equus caballus TaxID=9796 RepID=A0A3Q2HEJ7_HORSE
TPATFSSFSRRRCPSSPGPFSRTGGGAPGRVTGRNHTPSPPPPAAALLRGRSPRPALARLPSRSAQAPAPPPGPARFRGRLQGGLSSRWALLPVGSAPGWAPCRAGCSPRAPAEPPDARARRGAAFPKIGAKKAATVGGRAASEPPRWSLDAFPQRAQLGAACNSGPPAQHLFLKPTRPPRSTGIRVFRPACCLPSPGISGTELRGRIVETEAYLGPEDEAAHSRGGRQTPRNRSMFMEPGTLYVYLIYGMYFCMNVSSRGEGACVLLRALEPLGGLETMRQLRSTLRKGAAGRALRDRELCSGPSKLCQALAIDKSFDQRDLAKDKAVWLERGPPGPTEPAVVAAARVGIGHAGEWAHKPLRFYIQGSPWVSVVDRAAERDVQA